MQYLDDVAKRALAAFRPAMRISDDDYRELEYRLTTLPAGAALIATIVGGAIGASVLPFLVAQLGRQGKVFTSVPAAIQETIVFVGMWCIYGVLGYHTIRQLRLVNHIYTNYTHIDVLFLDPLFAFSWLTARTALGWVVTAYAFLVTVPGSFGNVLSVAIMAANVLFGVIAFVWPLLGIHRLMEIARRVRMASAAHRLETVITELHRRTDTGEFKDMAEMKDAIEALLHERDVLEKTPTWPWRRETLSGFASALLLPIILYLITRMIDTVLKP
jgi:hypothetical protein